MMIIMSFVKDNENQIHPLFRGSLSYTRVLLHQMRYREALGGALPSQPMVKVKSSKSSLSLSNALTWKKEKKKSYLSIIMMETMVMIICYFDNTSYCDLECYYRKKNYTRCYIYWYQTSPVIMMTHFLFKFSNTPSVYHDIIQSLQPLMNHRKAYSCLLLNHHENLCWRRYVINDITSLHKGRHFWHQPKNSSYFSCFLTLFFCTFFFSFFLIQLSHTKL